MLLREKTLIVIVAIFAILILIEFISSNSIVMGSFYSLEQNDTIEKVKQADGGFTWALQSLDETLLGRAADDESYVYMTQPYSSYVQEKMKDDYFRDQGINMLIMVDDTGRIVYWKGYDIRNRTTVPVSKTVRDAVYVGSPLLPNATGEMLEGIMVLPEGTMLVAARPITDRKMQSPPHGTMILGRYIDDGWVASLAKNTRLNLTMYRLNDPGLPADVREARNITAAEGDYFTLPQGDDRIVGYYIKRDVFDQPALVLRVEQPRPFYDKGKQTIAFIILWTLGTGVVIASLAIILLSRIVLSRLLALDASVKKISSSDDLSARVEAAGSDEISNLSQAINNMLASLEQSRQRLYESEIRYHAVVEDQSELICRFRPDGTITFTNEACRRYFGDEARLQPGQNFLQALPPVARGDVEALLPSLSPPDRPAGTLECRFDRSDGIQWLQWSIRAIFDRLDRVTEFQAVGRDITALKLNEEQIKAALKEKDALLKEIHHRVKNNLQIISSMLSLQEARVSDQGSREVLADSRNRIKSMALIHERLYGSRDLSSIDFAEYLRSLVSHLSSSYGTNGRISTRTDIESLSLNIDAAIPLGLIVNELVTNSFKHAFPGEATGEIFVELHHEGEKRYRLDVGDNGIGLPPDFDIERTDSLGLQLVNALSQQINCQVTLEREKGTVFKITFTIPEPRVWH